MAMWHWVAVWLALGASCIEQAPPGEQAGSAQAKTGYMVTGELSYLDGELVYEMANTSQWRQLRRGARPYQIVAIGPPALVTTLDQDLSVTTWAVSDTVHDYPGSYVVFCRPPLVVLAGLPDSEYTPATGCTLLGTDGAALWSGPLAVLLWPAGGPAESSIALFAQTDPAAQSAPDLLFPFGGAPQLLAVDAVSGALLWNADLGASSAVADVQLWGLTAERGLISLQYDYRRYEFLSFDRAAGSPLARWPLSGQPLTGIVYPGSFDEPAAVTVGDSVVSVAVYTEGRPEGWEFDLRDGTLHRVRLSSLETSSREENEAPARGSGPPAVDDPPFPQQLLPTAAAIKWRIPALVDEQGRVLVIDTNGAHWLDPAGAEGH